MKLNTRDAERTLHAHQGTDGFILIERIRYKEFGRSKWEEERVFLSNEELIKLVKEMQPEGDF
jgi:hypothetical protein